MIENIEEIDFTNPTEETQKIENIQKEIQHLNNLLKFPNSFKFTIAGSLIGYIFGKKFGGQNFGILSALGGGYLGQKYLYNGNELSDAQRLEIKNQIASLENQLKNMGIVIKGNNEEILSASEVKTMTYQSYDFESPYLEFIGKPALGFHALVYGLPKSGKSIWCLQFADYLANDYGKVLYIPSEEGLKGTLQDKLSEWTTNEKHLDVVNVKSFEKIIEKVKTKDYRFVFIDSVDYCKLSVDQVEEIKERNPNVSLITVKQVTKDGQFRGSQEYSHNCDVIISIENGIAKQRGRFNPESFMKVFPSSEKEENS